MTECEFMVDNPDRRKSLYATNIAVIVLNSVFSVTATFQNMPVIYAIIRTPTLHTPSNVLLCSLASTDLLVGCIIQPLSIALNAVVVDGKPFSCGLWKVKESFLLLFLFVSITTLVIISTERWLALHLHLRYHQIVTVPRTFMVIGLTWFFSIISIISWPLGLDFNTFTLIGAIVILISAVVLIFMYIKIFLILRRHKVLIESQVKFHQPSVNLRKHKKSSATMFYVVVLFFVFYSPTFYAMIHYLVSERELLEEEEAILWEVAKAVALINASANPLLYYWKMREIRRAVRSLFGCSSVLRVHVEDAIQTRASGSRENEFKSRSEQRYGSFSVRGSCANLAISNSKPDIREDHGTDITEVKERAEKKLFLMPGHREPGPSFREWIHKNYLMSAENSDTAIYRLNRCLAFRGTQVNHSDKRGSFP